MDDLEAETTGGRVRGSRQTAGRTATPVRVFRGVPYGAAPVGRRRFAAPEPPAPWAGVRAATEPAPSPMQSPASPFAGLIPGNTVGAVGEDCLTVDIWTPAGVTDALPVLVWVYGGAFLTGGSSIETYDGAALAADGSAVVVAVNYRLGVLGFGFFDHPAAATNCGLRDQQAALGWVRDNIGAFGGDPSRVTVFGESAGAGSLLHLLTAPGTADLARRCILQSPGVDHTLRPDDAERVTALFLGHLGLGPGELDRLWELPAAALVDAQEKTVLDALLTISSMPFHPVIDGAFLRATPSVAYAEGAAAGVDLLVSWTADEMRLYPNPAANDAGFDGIVPWVQHYLISRAGGDPGADRARRLVDYYREAIGGGPRSTPADVYAAIQTDGVMRLPARRIADAHARAGGRTYAAEFAWQAGPSEDGWERGAFHAVDLPFTFGTLDRAGWAEFLGAGAGASRLAGWHMAAWAAFAADGDPGAGAEGDGAPAGWPSYDADRRPTMILNETCRVAHDPLGDVAEAWDGLWTPDCRVPSMGVG